MNPCKTFTLKWWQGALFKWGVLALGIAVGAYWHDFFDNYLPVLLTIAAVFLAYVNWVWVNQ